MDEPAGVDGLERLGQGRPEQSQPDLVHRPLVREQFGQRGPGDVRSGQPRPLPVRLRVHDGGRVETADLASGIDLGAEPLTKVGIGGQLGPHHLDGHGTSPA